MLWREYSEAMLLDKFSDEKVTQIATLLAKLSGGRINYLKLIKLLYIIDKECIAKHGRSASNDIYVSMEHGPVLSHTYDLIKGTENGKHWGKHLKTKAQFIVEIAEESPTDLISKAEMRIILEVFDQHKADPDQWAIRDLTHTFSEWTDPLPLQKRMIPLPLESILKSIGGQDSEIMAQEIRAANQFANRCQ